MSAVRLANLYALRAHLDAMIMAEESEQGLPQPDRNEPGSCQKCGAAPDLVIDATTMDGTVKKRCQQCGEKWDV